MAEYRHCHGYRRVSLITEKYITFSPSINDNGSKKKCSLSCILSKDQVHIATDKCDVVTEKLFKITKYCIEKSTKKNYSRNLLLTVGHKFGPGKEKGCWLMKATLSNDLITDILEMVHDAIRLDVKITNVTAKGKGLPSAFLGTLQAYYGGGWHFPRDAQVPFGFGDKYRAAFFQLPGTMKSPGCAHREAIKSLDTSQDYQFTGVLTAELTLWMSSEYTNFYHGYFWNPTMDSRPQTIPIVQTFEKRLPTDFTIILNPTRVRFRCHKEFLAASSSYFAAFLDEKWNPKSPTEICLDDISEAGVLALLEFLYNLEMETIIQSWDLAAELFIFADKYNFSDLQERLTTMFLVKPVQWFSDVFTLQKIYNIINNNIVYVDLSEKMENILG